MGADKHYLPSMTVDQLLQYTEEASGKTNEEVKAKMLDISQYMTQFMYDDEFTYNNRLMPYKNSVLANAIKKTKMTAPDETPDQKVKATANDLRVLLSQSTYGVTGVWLRLLHSGFSVKLKPIDAMTRINLQADIAKGMIDFNRLFTGDMSSAIYFDIEEKIMKVFLDSIDYTTFMSPSDKHFLKYVMMKDSRLIAITLLVLMHPNGYEGFRYVCGETINTVDDKDGEQVKTNICGAESDALTIDLDELIYIQNDFTEDEITQLQKQQKNILSEKEVLAYQEKFKYNKPTTKTVDEDAQLQVTFAGGSMHNYITKSRKWMEEIILKSGMNTKNDLEILSRVVSNSAVGKYYYAITRIETPIHYADQDSIDVKSILTVSTNKELADKIIFEAKENIANTAYAIAVPKYTCPSCAASKAAKKAELVEGEVVEEELNNDLVTNINVLDLFFYLV